jgi:hypothetical protein
MAAPLFECPAETKVYREQITLTAPVGHGIDTSGQLVNRDALKREECLWQTKQEEQSGSVGPALQTLVPLAGFATNFDLAGCVT